MKTIKRAFLVTALIMLLSALLLPSAFANTEIISGVSVEGTMQFAGVEVEHTGLHGIRGVFTVNDGKIEKLEAAGYTVSYGALVGYASTYPSFSDLNINRKNDIASITVYESGAKRSAYFLDGAEGESRFAIATFFGSAATRADANREMRYRGFLKLEKGGSETYYYVDGSDTRFGEKMSIYQTASELTRDTHFGVDGFFDIVDRFLPVTDVYVDPTSAGGDGLSPSTAVKTLKEGYEKAVALINAGDAADVVVNLSDGKHTLLGALKLSGADVTVKTPYSITFRGSQSEEKSVISSNIDIEASLFTRDGDFYKYQLPETAKVDGQYPAFRDLYIDGRMCTLATSQGYFEMYLDSCDNASTSGLSAADRLLYVSQDALGGVDVDENGNVIGDLEFWVQTDWQVHSVHIEHIAYGKSTGFYKDGMELVAIRVKAEDWSALRGNYYNTLKNRRYWFKNNKAYLDEKGEFWYDEANGTIYMKPFELFKNTKTVSYPTSERLFDLCDAKNIAFQNLDITGTTINYMTDHAYVTGQAGSVKTTWTNPDTGVKEEVLWLPYGAIYGLNVENIRISDCSFYDIGNNAVNFRGAVDRVRVYRSGFENIGGSAVRFGQAVNTFNDSIHTRDIVVSNNFMQGIAVTYNCDPSILAPSVQNMDIVHNTILDSAYSAVSVGWRWKRYENAVNVENTHIDYNYIENFMTLMQDGGAIYTLGGNAPYEAGDDFQYLNTMSHNYVVITPETGNGKDHWTIFYHDQGSSHWLDHQNILVSGPDAQKTKHSYVSYQPTVTPHDYNITTDGMIFIGKNQQKVAYKNPVKNADGSTSYNDPQFTEIGSYKTNNKIINEFMFESFAAIAGTPQEAIVKETAEVAGCDGYHPTYGEWSAKK